MTPAVRSSKLHAQAAAFVLPLSLFVGMLITAVRFANGLNERFLQELGWHFLVRASPIKDKYDTVLEKNEKLEGQMVALSTSFQSMKEELLLQRIEEHIHTHAPETW